MMDIKKKFLVFSLIAGMSLCASVAMKNVEAKETQIWVGVGLAAAKAGHSAEACAGIGVLGVAQCALWGSAVGPAGTIMGAAFGL
ncbi:hypothetical protein [Prevotella heparinolytica]|uniref:hypothetical protein n=1 Tax=Prevotella heparinolytica TaxID=28113 RepID=UPI00101AD15C|nr:hypothetical protein [Bacteroides heparinolyticus]